MTITPHLFHAFLKCPTKCWLRSSGEIPTGNVYAEWVQHQNECYRENEIARLLSETPQDECASSPSSSRGNEAHSSSENLKTAKWRLAVDVPVQVELRSSRRKEAQISSAEIDQSLLTSAATIIESRLHAIERIPSEGRGKATQFIPIRFISRNKLTKDDRLLLAFDAFVLSELLGREVSLGKIIHGDDHTTLKVKTASLFGEVRKRLDGIAALLSISAPPDLVLNRHCPECEFRDRCRQKAIETDDLSLLAGMSAKERQKLRSKGIFTVTQLSYTFRPRRRPKRLRDKREKYHHALKALAIREKKIHIVGSPELKIEGTPVYLDVEGLPDHDFYYLIGLRIGHGDTAVQHSLWADAVADEGRFGANSSPSSKPLRSRC
jgi:predicted RecB family nuclease